MWRKSNIFVRIPKFLDSLYYVTLYTFQDRVVWFLVKEAPYLAG